MIRETVGGWLAGLDERVERIVSDDDYYEKGMAFLTGMLIMALIFTILFSWS